MYKSIISLALALVLSASLSSGAPVGLESVVDEVVAQHMSEKQIPGMSVAVVHMIDDEVTGHVVDFPERVWPAGGLNVSVVELGYLLP